MTFRSMPHWKHKHLFCYFLYLIDPLTALDLLVFSWINIHRGTFTIVMSCHVIHSASITYKFNTHNIYRFTTMIAIRAPFRTSEIQNAATKPWNLDSQSSLSSIIFDTGNISWKIKTRSIWYLFLPSTPPPHLWNIPIISHFSKKCVSFSNF